MTAGVPTSDGRDDQFTDIALTGFAKAAAYDQHRPRYPAESVQKLLDECRVAGVRRARLLDLAAGTGIFTESLAARDEEFEVVAVEPHDAMREVLAAKRLPRVTALSGRASSVPVPNESVDAVLVAQFEFPALLAPFQSTLWVAPMTTESKVPGPLEADCTSQAFHWFANETTLKELHRILAPHGCLGLIWNIEDWNAIKGHTASTKWEAEVHSLTWTFKDEEPRFRDEQWRQVFDDQVKSTPMSILVAANPLFALPVGEHTQRWTVYLSKEQAWKRYRTLSHIAILESDALERTYNKFMYAINCNEVETNASGEIAVHGTTHTVFTSKVPAEGRSSLTGR